MGEKKEMYKKRNVRVIKSIFFTLHGGEKNKKNLGTEKKGINCRTITHVNYLLVCVFIEKPANIIL
jgi:hypothetical protein